MLSHLFTSALAVSSVAGAVLYDDFAASLAARQTVTGHCPALHMIVGAGANSTNPSSIGRLITLMNNVTSQVPDSDFVSVPYNKVQVGGMGQNLMPGAIQEGIMNFEQYVPQFVQSCPNSKIAFVGYSSGAVITMGSFCGGSVPQNLAGNQVVAVAIYGDPTRVPGQPYDIGTGPACIGKDSTLRNPASCGNYASIIKSWCDLNDPQCCSGPNSDYAIHLSYPGKYDLVAAKYIVDQYNMAVGGGSSSMSSNSSMSATGSATSSSATSTGTGLIGGGLGASTTTTSASVESSASAASMASALSALGAGASSSASSAASSMTSAASSARSSATSSAASQATAAATPTSTLTPANPNSASLLAPSFGLGALAVIMVALY